jgi:hypothetical protein
MEHGVRCDVKHPGYELGYKPSEIAERGEFFRAASSWAVFT